MLEIHRDPVADSAAPFGWRYATSERLGATSSASPLAAPHVRLSVSDLLP